MPLVEIPSAWLLIMPCGCPDGWYVGLRGDTIITPTAEAAWGKFTKSKRERQQLERDGWTVRAKRDDESSASLGCVHEGKDNTDG